MEYREDYKPFYNWLRLWPGWRRTVQKQLIDGRKNG